MRGIFLGVKRDPNGGDLVTHEPLPGSKESRAGRRRKSKEKDDEKAGKTTGPEAQSKGEN